MRYRLITNGEKNASFLNQKILYCLTLFWIHVATCVMHLGGFITGIVFIVRGEDWSIPVVTSYADWRQRDTTRGGCDDENCFITPTFGEGPGHISLTGLVTAFHALSFTWQSSVVFGVWGVRELYASELAKCRNGLRWGEYALSAPLMTVVIAAIFGVVDVYVLSGLAICTSALQAFGYAQELLLWMERDVSFVKYFPIIAGSAFFLAYWSIVSLVFAESITRSRSSPENNMETVIVVTFVTMTVLFCGFAFVLAYDAGTRKYPNKQTTRYIHFEGVYCILSVTSKWLLGAFLIWAIRIRETEIKLDFIVNPPCEISTLFANGTNTTNATTFR